MKVIWQIEDGYVGNSRPHTTEVDDQELSDCDTEAEREELISDAVQDDFAQAISWSEIGRRVNI